MMNGEPDSIKQRLANFKELLHKRIDALSVTKINQPENIELYLNLSRDALNKLSDSEAGEIAYALGQYAAFIQKEENSILAQLNWCKMTLNSIVLPLVGNYKGYSLEERRAQAEAENDSAQVILKLQKLLQGEYDSIKYLSQRIEFMAKILLGLQSAKRAQKYS